MGFQKEKGYKSILHMNAIKMHLKREKLNAYIVKDVVL